MCGLAGFFDASAGMDCATLRHRVLRMANTLVHRGPDDSGDWVDERAGIALGFRRLAIVDLSPAGHQPMVSESGRYVITFNGEVYNFASIRRELESSAMAPEFRGGSDTEVMLAAFEAWGIEKSVQKFIGMFAFALWDRKEQRLYLVRDRLGVKPLYYAWCGRTLLFGSELKALKAHPSFQNTINRDSIALMMRYSYIPAPHTIYNGVYKLPAGSILSTSSNETRSCKTNAYWSVKETAEEGIRNPFSGSEGEAVEELDVLLRDAVGLRMIADVPLGVFLSGGVDSSVVVAQMQAQSSRPVKTFTIGFNEDAYNEASYAKAVAQHLGTDHTELYVTSNQAMSVIPKLPALYDEPFADASQIPTYLVSEMARQKVTVSLSGDGGDEMFAGYNRYFWGRGIWKRIGWLPRGFRSMGASALMQLSPSAWERLFRAAGPLLPAGIKQRNPGDKLTKLADVLRVNSPEEMYWSLISNWNAPCDLVAGSEEKLTAFTDREQWAHLSDFTERMMYMDSVMYLPDDILVKVDRASMSVSLEAREPLLDHRIVEYSWKLPLDLKIRNGQGKWLLRQVLNKYVPSNLIERPKAGFGVPIDTWLRGPLRGWAEDLLEPAKLRADGYLNPEMVREKWDEHLSGRCNWQYYLWSILMFQAWIAAQ